MKYLRETVRICRNTIVDGNVEYTRVSELTSTGKHEGFGITYTNISGFC